MKNIKENRHNQVHLSEKNVALLTFSPQPHEATQKVYIMSQSIINIS